MFDNASSLLFYVANLTNLLQKVSGVYNLQCYTACPPGIDELEDYSYVRSIHLSLVFTYFNQARDLNKFYMTFRYTLPYHKPSRFSSIEVFDKNYKSRFKFKLLPNQDNFTYLNNFETSLKDIIQNGFPVEVDTVSQTELTHD